jgi:hypothetical protein
MKIKVQVYYQIDSLFCDIVKSDQPCAVCISHVGIGQDVVDADLFSSEFSSTKILRRLFEGLFGNAMDM